MDIDSRTIIVTGYSPCGECFCITGKVIYASSDGYILIDGRANEYASGGRKLQSQDLFTFNIVPQTVTYLAKKGEVITEYLAMHKAVFNYMGNLALNPPLDE